MQLPSWSHAAPPSASGRTTPERNARCARSSVSLYEDGDAASCISAWPRGPDLGPVRAHCRVKRRAIISPVVLDPASDNWIEHSRQILDRFITALRQLPATKFVTDRLRCLVRHRRTEIEAELPFAIL